MSVRTYGCRSENPNGFDERARVDLAADGTFTADEEMLVAGSQPDRRARGRWRFEGERVHFEVEASTMWLFPLTGCAATQRDCALVFDADRSVFALEAPWHAFTETETELVYVERYGHHVVICKGNDEPRRIAAPPGSGIRELVVDPDLRCAFALTEDPWPTAWRIDLSSGDQTRVAQTSGGTGYLLACPSAVVLAGSNTSLIERFAWDGSPLPAIVMAHPRPDVEFFGVEGIALSFDGTVLAVRDGGEAEDRGLVTETYSSGETRIFELATGRQVAQREGGDKVMVLSADGAFLVTPTAISRTRDLSAAEVAPRAFQTGVAICGTRQVAMYDGRALFLYDLDRGAEVYDFADSLPLGARLDGGCALSSDARGDRFVATIAGRRWTLIRF